MLLTAFLIGLPVTIRYLGAPISAILALYVLVRRRDRIAGITLCLTVIITASINLGIGGFAVIEYYIDTLQKFAGRYAMVAQVAEASSGIAPGFFERIGVLFTDIIPGTLVPLFHGPQVQALFARFGLGFVPTMAQLGITFFLLLGILRLLRRNSRAAEWVVLGYGAVLFVLPTNWNTLASKFRYWTPLIPFGYHYLLAAVQWIVDGIPGSSSEFMRKIRYLPAALLAIGMLALNLGRDFQEAVFNPIIDRVPDIYVGTEWLRTHSEPDDVIMVATPTLYSLYLQREVVPFPKLGWESRILYSNIRNWQRAPGSLNTLCEILDRFDVAYILVNTSRVPDQGLFWDPYISDTFLPTIRSQPEKFNLLWSDNTGFNLVYEIAGDVECSTVP
jgi:hypothetical protein